MNDLIYRDAAIEVVSNAILKDENEIDALIDLPAADYINREYFERTNEAKDNYIKYLQNKNDILQEREREKARKKIYIAGPVTGVDGYEETFAKAADDLRAREYEPVNPVAPGLVEGWTYRDYINRGFQMLMDCDGMLLLPGYMDSKGAALELHYALAVGMEIIKG